MRVGGTSNRRNLPRSSVADEVPWADAGLGKRRQITNGASAPDLNMRDKKPVLSRERAGMTEPAIPPASPTPFPRRASVGRGRARLLARGTPDLSGPASHSGGAASDSHRLPWALSLIPDCSVSVGVNRSQAAGSQDPSNGGSYGLSACGAPGHCRRYPRRRQQDQPDEHPDKHRTRWRCLGLECQAGNGSGLDCGCNETLRIAAGRQVRG